MYLEGDPPVLKVSVPPTKTSNSKLPPCARIATWETGTVGECDEADAFKFIFSNPDQMVFLKENNALEAIELRTLLEKTRKVEITKFYNHKMPKNGDATIEHKKDNIAFISDAATAAAFRSVRKAVATAY